MPTWKAIEGIAGLLDALAGTSAAASSAAGTGAGAAAAAKDEWFYVSKATVRLYRASSYDAPVLAAPLPFQQLHLLAGAPSFTVSLFLAQASQAGPVSQDQLASLIASGAVDRTTFGWCARVGLCWCCCC